MSTPTPGEKAPAPTPGEKAPGPERRHMERTSSTSAGAGSSSSRSRKKESLSVAQSSSDAVVAQINSNRISTILNWSNNVLRFRVTLVTKAFYRWKYYQPPSVVVEKPVEVKEENPDVAEQKSSYLLLFAENEKLREQLSEIRKTTISRDRQLRISAFRSTFCVILRARCSSKLRYYYDLWQNNCRMMKHVVGTTQKVLELDVGLQRIESERNYVKKIESSNAHLKLSLIYTIAFFKWKSNTALSKLAAERRLFEAQRQSIFAELQRIREAVCGANAQEVAMLNSALTRGDQIAMNVIALRKNLQAVATYRDRSAAQAQAQMQASVADVR